MKAHRFTREVKGEVEENPKGELRKNIRRGQRGILRVDVRCLIFR